VTQLRAAGEGQVNLTDRGTTVAASAAPDAAGSTANSNEFVVQEGTDLHRIVVVGGGAGGLELATRLGDTLGKRNKAYITLIEKARTHFWKPHLHEIAAGSMDVGVYQTNYLAQSHWHHFRFRIGEMVGLDRERREVIVAPFIDEDGERITPARRFGYDTLVIAVGSLSNDFGTPGAREHAIFLETVAEADKFHRRLVNSYFRAHTQAEALRAEQLDVAIIGAGATGVELAAELHRTTRTLVEFGFDRIDPEEDIQLILIEAADRILPALPPRLSESALRLLKDLHIDVRTSSKVAEVLENGVKLATGEVIPAEHVVWAAGVKAPDFLKDLAGLETNRINQLVVLPTLQTTRDEDIFAIGDCAACPWVGKPGATVPPRAQSAHQQASHLVKQIRARLSDKPLTEWRYRDFGSLVSLGEYSTVGNLMGGLSGGNLWLEGWFARMMYLSLYKMHELALHGFWKVTLDTAARLITRRTEPHVKLH
jgi:NADH:ubiquinone reductase (H+-translocating)